jgi:HAD superfamily 5'-nucleotidase-like hydrolase
MTRKSDRFPTETFLQLLNHFQPSSIRYCRRIFVNRNLRMNKIQAVGFDMDYTLAIYKPAFEELAWRLALQRLVEEFDFPKKVLGFQYDRAFALRGLVIDMVHGNVLKMDRYRHVWKACHGTRPVDVETRNALYRQKRIRFSKPTYFLVDTLFSLPETHMYAQIVDLLDENREGDARTFDRAYQCIRQAVDGIHRDGTLKTIVRQDLGKYIERDTDAAYALERFIYSGKKLFLVTNSDWDYTACVLSFLLDGVIDSFPKWHDYFEHIVVKASKPEFFSGGRPLVPETSAPEEIRHKTFRGGNLRAFEGLLKCFGDKILYIGDHIFGDILRSKKSSTWRTAMVIPEMETELEGLEAVRQEQAKTDHLAEKRLSLEIEANYQQRLLMSLLNIEQLATGGEPGNGHPITRVVEVSEKNISDIRRGLERVERELEANEAAICARFNPTWGMLFREGATHTVFAEQVEDWACLYTSRVSNFLSYSPLHYFRAQRDLLPHERET